MVKIRLLAITLSICLMAACSPIYNAIFTPTPTLIPLSDINLRSIPFLPGDLPADYSAGQFRYDNLMGGVTGYVNGIYQEYKMTGEKAGWVSILLFDSVDRRDSAYSVLIDGLGKSGQPIPGIEIIVAQSSDVGEKAMYNIMSGPGENTSTLIFIRCQAIADITLIHKGDLPTITNYAKRLDERLQPIVCRP
jgi:hypothetical protein